MQEYAYTLGNAVKQARLGLKMTQLEVADRIKADERTVLNIEHYKGNPKMEILWPLLRALGIDVNIVFYPEKALKSNDIVRLQILLSDCIEDELQLLLPICESVLDAFRSAQGKNYKEINRACFQLTKEAGSALIGTTGPNLLCVWLFAGYHF